MWTRHDNSTICLTQYNIWWYLSIAIQYKGLQVVTVFLCILDQLQFTGNRMIGPILNPTDFPCPSRRVTLKASSFFPLRLLSEVHVMPLTKSPNVLSAGRDPHIQSAMKLIPSGVSGKRFFRSMFVPGGTGQGRKVTRHPFVFSPRRDRKVCDAFSLPMQSCFLPGTGRSSDLKGFDQPTRPLFLALSGGAS